MIFPILTNSEEKSDVNIHIFFMSKLPLEALIIMSRNPENAIVNLCNLRREHNDSFTIRKNIL